MKQNKTRDIPRRDIIRKRMRPMLKEGGLRLPKLRLPKTPGGKEPHVVPFTPDGARRYNHGMIKIV